MIHVILSEAKDFQRFFVTSFLRMIHVILSEAKDLGRSKFFGRSKVK